MFAAPFLFVRVALPPEKMALWLMIVVTTIFGNLTFRLTLRGVDDAS